MATRTTQGSRSDTWSVDVPFVTSNGKPVAVTGHRPSYHAAVFFLAAGSSARALLNLLDPRSAYVYFAVYFACVIAGVVLGSMIRRQKNDVLSRMCSCALGLVGFAGPAALLLLAPHAAAPAPAAAGYAPLAAAGVVAAGTLGAELLTLLFPSKRVRARTA